MRAPLRQTHAQQNQAQKRHPKRTGGDDGITFAEYAYRIYQDQRADAQSRQLLLAVTYALTMAPADENAHVWATVRAALGTGTSAPGSLRHLVRHDLPRYELPGTRWGDAPLDRLCTGPRMRPHPDGADDFRNRLNVCGAPAQEMAVEKLPGTGWHENHWFCPRHRDHLIRVREQVREQIAAAPAPVPNQGGLLPSYFDADCLKLYRWATTPSWQPPTYGMRADDWPNPDREPVPQRARLRLITTQPPAPP
ncbi:hypothetical protein ACH4VR_25445 [Streptomyces sp. NPDC020883]|uniref:hypothetical protein n=1 Tax=Streptomyces sp. NPDC020883 TaxID=3365099 RepID=UPI0037BD79F6